MKVVSSLTPQTNFEEIAGDNSVTTDPLTRNESLLKNFIFGLFVGFLIGIGLSLISMRVCLIIRKSYTGSSNPRRTNQHNEMQMNKENREEQNHVQNVEGNENVKFINSQRVVSVLPVNESQEESKNYDEFQSEATSTMNNPTRDSGDYELVI